jgi:hypothetical protein
VDNPGPVVGLLSSAGAAASITMRLGHALGCWTVLARTPGRFGCDAREQSRPISTSVPSLAASGVIARMRPVMTLFNVGNPVTFGVFFTRCQASSVRSIFTSTYPGKNLCSELIFRPRLTATGPILGSRRATIRTVSASCRRRPGQSLDVTIVLNQTSWSSSSRATKSLRNRTYFLLAVPNQLGVAYNAHIIETILTLVAPGLGWR